MSPNLTNLFLLFGRILASLIFLLAGSAKFLQWNQTAQFMTDHGMAAVQVLLPAAAALEVAGGLALLTGCFTRPFAVLLCLFLIPTTLIFHNFWEFQGQQMQEQMQNFFKNIAIMGGLLGLAAAGAGAFSLDAWMLANGPRFGRARPVSPLM